MEFSQATTLMIGITLLSIPTIEYGGYFLLTEWKKQNVIKSDFQGAFFRAGHAHAGVLVLLALIAYILIDTLLWQSWALWALRLGFFASPLLISGGFFFSAMGDGNKPNQWVRLIYIGAIVLALSLVVLGGAFIFG